MKNAQLFKERITITDYSELIGELSCAIDGGETALRKLLLGRESPELYSAHGKYTLGMHKHCGGFYDDTFYEKRLCKCMFYLNSEHTKRCEKCSLPNRYKLVGDFRIIDYEVPAFYCGKGIGEIDLIITDGVTNYATEVKPFEGNNETLLRMVAEIMTYTEGFPAGTYKKAIAFFEKDRENGKITTQQEEYESASPVLRALLKKADITVFRFEEVDERTYRICKL